jgi:hypothetical protein
MRGVRLYIVGIFLFACAAAQSQVGRRRNTNWIFPREQDEVYRTNNYEITERSCSNDEWPLCVFINRLWIVPEAYEFSPDDRKVLMRMVGDDVSAATAQESIEASRTYKDWWYSLNSQTGRVLREFRTNRIPQKWW